MMFTDTPDRNGQRARWVDPPPPQGGDGETHTHIWSDAPPTKTAGRPPARPSGSRDQGDPSEEPDCGPLIARIRCLAP